jgi:hypothetical protein
MQRQATITSKGQITCLAWFGAHWESGQELFENDRAYPAQHLSMLFAVAIPRLANAEGIWKIYS